MDAERQCGACGQSVRLIGRRFYGCACVADRAAPAPQEAIAGAPAPGTGERASEPAGGPCAASCARDGGGP